ncbi:unnamed protein product, partial [Polarella glacialis]
MFRTVRVPFKSNGVGRSKVVVLPTPGSAASYFTRHCGSGAAEPGLQPQGRDLPLETLRRRTERLTGLLRRLHLPQLSHFTAFGQEYLLPLRASSPPVPLRDIPQHQVEYLTGFFDGDGCVTPAVGLASCTLSACQVSNAAEVLVLFHRLLGGGIYRKFAGRGLRKPALQWVINGVEGKRVASVLSQVPSMKRPQLLLAVDWPSCVSKRPHAKSSLKDLKQGSSSVSIPWSWWYFTGFFDAEGSIRVPPKSVGINLEVTQNSRELLIALRVFLVQEFPGLSVGIYRNRNAHVLKVWKFEASCFILRRMLSCGLLVKRRHAEVALQLSSDNHFQIRDSLSELNGNGSRYSRLDADGCLRSQRISFVMRSARAGTATNRALLRNLREEHILLNTRLWYAQLRKDIRELLSNGASVNSKPASGIG